ncbi:MULTISPECIES: polyribonucleotide nucleotidyltransferase [Sulfitobacter]|jgi:polyribonucleotide nucleotidyltransferase|uniref:Polyribonucleotide nucleotidyltransferase n=7 Tax=Sulfitobacter TaxID=60136 RepID=A0A1H2ZS75_9RHOB|nr:MULTISPECIES: polyribonucleotide nucleotidyltransferase [Sulfitobacter]MAB16028.1 polyribonucleotide nucleotidyltransferase [Roseobacter sp.]NKX47217.1 polyribonucleotide nucleotidyltransferase [Rhodobacteraceae bacterium R_SAG8]AXI49470.1 polyribonucleotide nucleotidyltransferase [Sulfitobacter sp. SK025]EAP82223.1 polyribonucleotide nucleotidyltransferase [Sulfitobacter sp. NAS-14.1]KAJ30141.1 polynucleotide phosphorylase [Sulfitobacter pontiacus 3SOLIMAR09]|tara:strand:- start:74 stop:2209 length:2136 start_codon:yes stop_codon:yes gene_type:complete
MFNVTKKSMQWGEETLTLETGKVARQADGSVIATLGETSVMANVTFARQQKPGQDFFPLTVHYQEKYYAAGKVPGGFFKREARPTEKETLTARLIDRPIRPLFVPGFKNEVLVMCTVLSHDLVNDPDMVAMIAASAALTISGAPFRGPIGACRVGFEDGDYVLNPTVDDMQDLRLNPDQRLDLVVAGTKEAVMMVESEAYELSEEEMLGAVKFAHEQIQPVIDLIIDLAEDAAKEPFDFQPVDYSDLSAAVKAAGEDAMRAAFAIADKQERTAAVAAARETIKAALTEEQLEDANLGSALKGLEASILRGDVVKTGKRIDGRKTDEIRDIVAETGILPRTHGSSLFTRGETQGLVVTTLGTGDDEQFIDALHGNFKSNFMLHYNFPPYSVGEVGRVGGPGRREIGHGKLAWRALQAVLPASTDFPYTIRVVSEITESNGSSSMASVCGGSLSMMDAGVPLKAPVAGVAMGLILEEDGSYAILSDILGDEDHLGDMDFKVAGTEAGITSLQMDIKIAGITPEIMEKALAQAKAGRVHILGEMNKAISGAGEFSVHAPRIETMQIPTDKIREVIGSGGKVIREIVEVSGAKVDINDEGIIKIASPNGDSIKKAYDMIWSIVAEPEEGAVYTGTVVKIVDFGAFVNFFGKRDGLVHVSQIENRRLNHPSDVLKEGQEVKVKLLGFDDRGKVRLSMKVVDQETGEEIKKEEGGEA